MKAIKGTVDAVYENSVNTRNGPATSYALKVDGARYSAGFKPLGCKEGDIVEFVIKQQGDYWNVDGAVTVVGEAAVNVAPPSGPAMTSAPAKQPGDWNAKDRRITFLACRNAAMVFAKLAIDNGCIKLGTKDKEEVLLGIVNKYSEEFFIQSWIDEGYADLKSVSEAVEVQQEEE